MGQIITSTSATIITSITITILISIYYSKLATYIYHRNECINMLLKVGALRNSVSEMPGSRTAQQG